MAAIRFCFYNPLPVTTACPSFLETLCCSESKAIPPDRRDPAYSSTSPLSQIINPLLPPPGRPAWREHLWFSLSRDHGSPATPSLTGRFCLLVLSLLYTTVLTDCTCSETTKHLQKAEFLDNPNTLLRTASYSSSETAVHLKQSSCCLC